MVDLKFINEEKAEEVYQEYLDDYGCAAMYKVNLDGLESIKMESNF